LWTDKDFRGQPRSVSLFATSTLGGLYQCRS
jgi:hypothetical protein